MQVLRAGFWTRFLSIVFHPFFSVNLCARCGEYGFSGSARGARQNTRSKVWCRSLRSSREISFGEL